MELQLQVASPAAWCGGALQQALQLLGHPPAALGGVVQGRATSQEQPHELWLGRLGCRGGGLRCTAALTHGVLVVHGLGELCLEHHVVCQQLREGQGGGRGMGCLVKEARGGVALGVRWEPASAPFLPALEHLALHCSLARQRHKPSEHTASCTTGICTCKPLVMRT